MPHTFSFTPQAPHPAQSPLEVGKQIQFRWNGVDLGGPNATVLDIVGAGVTVNAQAPPAAGNQSQTFPLWLRFRGNGVDVGGPDVRTVNFQGSAFVLTRDGDKLTINY
jgi:hypothetical protein